MPTFSRNLPAAFATVACLAVLLCLVIPLTVFSSNSGEFNVGFFNLWQHLLLPLLLAACALAVALAMLPVRLFQIVNALLLALAFGVYLQSSFLVWNYGLFDGTEIKWKNHAFEARVDLLIWVFIVVLALFFHKRLHGFRNKVLLFLSLISCASVLEATLKPIKWRTAPLTSRLDSLYQFSDQSNFLVLVLDSFTAPAFDELAARGALSSHFSDFTYYPNTLAAFSTTAPSIPALLSGAEYDNSRPFESFLSSALGESSLPAVMQKAGYRVNILSVPQFCPRLKQPCTSLARMVSKDPQTVERRELYELLDVALFRAAPQPLKRRIYNKERWFLQRLLGKTKNPRPLYDSLSFIDMFERKAGVLAGPATFKFLHLMLPHPPYRFDARCAPLRNRQAREKDNYQAQAECALSLAERVLTRLKELKVYDNTFIVIMADHGHSVHYLPFKRPKHLPIMEQALPLLLVKPFEQRAADGAGLKRSSAPVGLVDLPATVTDAAKVQAVFPGTTQSIFSNNGGAGRIRRYRSYGWQKDNWQRQYMPTMVEYRVSGDVRDPGAWTRGEALAPKK